MNYEIVNRAAFTVFGTSIRVSMTDGENLADIPKFWGDSAKAGLVDRILESAHGASVFPGLILGLCSSGGDDGTFSYWICAECAADHIPEGYEIFLIPANNWADFESIGALPEAIQATWQHVMGEFLPNSEYQHAPGPELEVYGEGDVSSANYMCSVCIPVIAK